MRGNGVLAMDLARRADVARIDPNPRVRVALPGAERPEAARDGTPHAVLAAEPGVSFVRAPQVWALGITGAGVVVGGADTGIRWTHQALLPRYRGSGIGLPKHDYNWHDSIHSGGGVCGANSPVPCDDDGHGSHTIGTAVGWDGGTNQVGVAPGAKWIGCRNMDQGYGTPATYLECFEFFLAPYPVGGTPAQGDPSRAPDVTTNSWGCPPSEGCNTGNFETMRQAVAAQRAAGILTEASAGNSGSGCSTVSDPPAIFDEAFVVGALSTGTDTIASFSSRGPVTVDGSNRVKPDIAAPGTSTRSVSGSSDTGYVSMSGTSMAGPHVGGGAALVISAFPELRGDVDAVEQRLAASAARISSSSCGSTSGAYPNNTFGWGRMDLGCAIPGLVSGSATICEGSSATLSVALVGSGPWTLTWSDGHVQVVTGASPATRVVSPSATTTYTVTGVASGSCDQPAAGSATVTVEPDTQAPAVTAPAPLVVDQTLCCGAGA
ncbi:MAG: hypothetical protein DYH06_22290, partial [Acidobacteria bacterium ACB2]|nr:hypothetical protein [Acidobacteria bacterium ACB2]